MTYFWHVITSITRLALFILLTLAFKVASFAQTTRVLLGVKWNVKSEVFNSMNISTKKFKEIKNLTYVSGAELGESTMDAANKRYFYKSNSGVTVANVTDGTIIDTFGNATKIRGIEYDSNKIIGTYWNGTAVMLASLNLDTKKLDDIGILKGVTGSEQGETTFDAVNKRYFIKTNLGITIINAATTAIIDTIKNSIGMRGIEYDQSTNSLIGNYWNGKNVILVSLNISTKKLKTIGTLKGVNETTLGESTFDIINKTYFIKTNLGITVINTQSAAIIDTIADNILLKSMEFLSFDEREVLLRGKCINDTTFFKLSYIENIDSVKWNFGDSLSGKDNLSNKTNNVSHVYKNYGDYLIRLITFNNNQSDTIESEISFEKPKADFSYIEVCEDKNAVFTNKTARLNKEPDYRWKFGDGQTSALESPQHLYEIGGISQTFNVTLVVKTQYGCADSIIKPVNIFANPKSNFKFTLNGRQVSFTSFQSSNLTHLWLFGDGDSSNSANPIHLYKTLATNMNVCLKVTTADGCISETCKNLVTGSMFENKINGFKIYPNPNSGNFTIEIDNPEKDVLIEVYNSVGELIESVEKVGKISNMNLNVAAGIYLVKVRNGEMGYNQKVSVVK